MHQRKRHSKRWLYLVASSISLATLLLLLLLLPSLDRPTSSVWMQSTNENEQSSNETTTIRLRRLPRAIIIGTRKSGTRALLKFLELNPAVRSAANEVHYFDRQVNYRKGIDWYRRQMPTTSPRELAIEKSPAYFVTKFVPERVAQMDPQMKLIIVFRNPVIRLISDYSQLIANRIYIKEDNDEHTNKSSSQANSILWLEAAKEFERHILTGGGGGGSIASGQVDERKQIVRTGMYSMYLEKWLTAFPRSQFHFVNGERLISEPHIELQKLELFLNLKPVIKREHFVFNSSKGFYCITSSPHHINSEQPICLSNSKGRRHVEVGQELIEKLQNFYKPYNDYLTSLTGISFAIN